LFDSEKRIALPAWKRRIGFVFQDNRLFPHLSVKNNLAYGRFMNGLARDPSHEAHVIQMLDIEKLLARDIGDLSGGEQQRVAIGRALLAKPQLLLLDEPMSSLDANRKREIQPYLLRLAAEGVPMIYVSHDADEIAELAGRIVTVENGIARI
jgi:molybdate transport system ATP-binding protein